MLQSFALLIVRVHFFINCPVTMHLENQLPMFVQVLQHAKLSNRGQGNQSVPQFLIHKKKIIESHRGTVRTK